MKLYGYIYKIENLVNNKVYIGQTTMNIQKRKDRHFHSLKANKHHNHHLQRAFNRYGSSNFDFKILNWANTQDELNKLEIYYMDKYDCLDRNKGYNIRLGGANGKLSSETMVKLFKFQRENNPFRGKTHSLTSRFNLSINKQGKGLFGFTSAHYDNRTKTNPWKSQIRYKGKRKALGVFPDPLSAELVYRLVWDEIYGNSS